MGLLFPIFQDSFWQSESKQKITRSSATERSETLYCGKCEFELHDSKWKHFDKICECLQVFLK